MAAISASLLAAAAPSPTRLSSITEQGSGTAQAVTGGFADILSQAATVTANPEAATEVETDLTDSTTRNEIAESFAAIGLVAQQLPVQLPLDPATVTAAPAQPSPQPLAVDAPGRGLEFQLNNTPVAQNTPNPTPLPAQQQPRLQPTQSQPPVETALPTEGPQTPLAVTLPFSTPVATAPTTTNVASTPGEVANAAARPRTVVPQTPVVVEQLPAPPVELGYGMLGPVVNRPPVVSSVQQVSGAASQLQLEQITANPRMVNSDPGSLTTPTQPPIPAFGTVLAAGNAPTGPANASTAQQAGVVPTTAQPVAVPTSGTTTGEIPGQTPTDVPTNVGRGITDASTVPTLVVSEPASQAAFFPTAAGPAIAPRNAETNDSSATAGAIQQQTSAVPMASTTSADVSATTSRGTPNTPPSVTTQLSEAFLSHARVVNKGDIHEFQMRLDPPELGEVKVRVLAMGDRVEARLVVSDEAVRRMIESQLPELRQRLEAAGLSLPNFDVTTDGGGKQTSRGGDNWERSQLPSSPSAQSGGQQTPRRPRPMSAGGLIDVTA